MLQPTFLCAGILWQSLLGKGQTTKNGYLCHRSHNKHPPSPDFQIVMGALCNCFWEFFFWGRLVQPVTTSPFPFLSSPLLPLRASPPQTSKNHQKWTGSVSRKTSGFKQGNRILGKALRLTELRTASLKTTGFKPGSQLCCLGRFGGEKRGND